MFQLKDIRVSFGTRLALETGTLSFPAGSTAALMGPNGSGKTTLLRVLAGLQEPSSGHIQGSREHSVWLYGYIGTYGERERDREREEHLQFEGYNW